MQRGGEPRDVEDLAEWRERRVCGEVHGRERWKDWHAVREKGEIEKVPLRREYKRAELIGERKVLTRVMASLAM